MKVISLQTWFFVLYRLYWNGLVGGRQDRVMYPPLCVGFAPLRGGLINSVSRRRNA